MRIRSFFILLTTVISVLLILMAAALMLNTTRMSEKANIHAQALMSISVAQQIKLALFAHARDQRLATETGSQYYRELQAAEKQRAVAKLEEMRQYVTSEEEANALGRVTSEVLRYIEVSERNHVQGTPSLSAPTLTDEWNLLMEHIDTFIGVNQRQAAGAAEAVRRWDERSDRLGTGAIAIAFLIVAATMLFFRQRIYLPLQNLNRTISSYAHGKGAARASASGAVEISEIGAAFNEMADALEQSRQRQLQFMAGVVHDLKNPLTAIRGYTEILLKRNEANDELAGSLGIILRQVGHFDTMLRDLQDATSIEAGRLVYTMTEIDICAVVKRSVDLFASLSPIHTLHYEAPANAIQVRADEHRLGQVFGNLISNAIKYSPKGGDIQVRIELQESNVRIRVADHGLGVSPLEFDRIFLPFARSKATREKFPGIGLGLSVSRKIIAAHAGAITIESMLGKGSTFSVKLPLPTH